MRRGLLTGTLITLLMLAGCSPVAVTTSHDPYAPFAEYGRFDWLRGGGAASAAERLLVQQLKFTLEQVLLERGLIRDEANPDLLIEIAAESRERTARQRIEHRDYRVDPRLYRDLAEDRRKDDPLPDPRWLRETRTVETRTLSYTEGRVVVTFVDRASGEPVWQAVLAGKLADDPLPRLREALLKALAQFPPRG